MHMRPDEVVASAQAIVGCAGELETALRALQETVTSGNPWGGDEPGTVFGMAYAAVLDHAMQVYASHADLLVGAGDGLIQMAERVVNTDQAVAQRFATVASRMGG